MKKAFPNLPLHVLAENVLFDKTEMFSDEFFKLYNIDDDPLDLDPDLSFFSDKKTGEIQDEIGQIIAKSTSRARILYGDILLYNANDFSSVSCPDFFKRIYTIMTQLTDDEIKFLSAYDDYRQHAKRGSYNYNDLARYATDTFSKAVSARMSDFNTMKDAILNGTYDSDIIQFQRYKNFGNEYFKMDIGSSIFDAIREKYQQFFTTMYKECGTADITKITDYFKTSNSYGMEQNGTYDLDQFMHAPDTMFLNPNLTDEEQDAEISKNFNRNSDVNKVLTMLHLKFFSKEIDLAQIQHVIEKCVLENKKARDNKFKTTKMCLMHNVLQAVLLGKLSSAYEINYVTDYHAKQDTWDAFKNFITRFKDYIFDYQWLGHLVSYSSFMGRNYTNYNDNIKYFLRCLQQYRFEDNNEDYYYEKLYTALRNRLETNPDLRHEQQEGDDTDYTNLPLSTVAQETVRETSIGSIYFIESILGAQLDRKSFSESEGTRYTNPEKDDYQFDETTDIKKFNSYIITKKYPSSVPYDGLKICDKNEIIASIIALNTYYYHGCYNDIQAQTSWYGSDKFECFNPFTAKGDFFIEKVLPKIKSEPKNPDNMYYYYSKKLFFYRSVFNKMICVQSIFDKTMSDIGMDFDGSTDFYNELATTLNKSATTVFESLSDKTVIGLGSIMDIQTLMDIAEPLRVFQLGTAPTRLVFIPSHSFGDMNNDVQAQRCLKKIFDPSLHSKDAIAFAKMAITSAWMEKQINPDVTGVVIDLDNIVVHGNHPLNKAYDYWDSNRVPNMFDKKGHLINAVFMDEHLYPGDGYQDELTSSYIEGHIMERTYDYLKNVAVPVLKEEKLISPFEENEILSNSYDQLNSYSLMTNSAFSGN
jgi:hypothetical protein